MTASILVASRFPPASGTAGSKAVPVQRPSTMLPVSALVKFAFRLIAPPLGWRNGLARAYVWAAVRALTSPVASNPSFPAPASAAKSMLR